MNDRRPASKVVRLADVPPAEIEGDGARAISGQPLLELGEGTGAFDVRFVRIRRGGVSADHAHPWEQANYVLAGAGRVTLEAAEHAVGPGSFVYVAPNMRHVFSNDGEEDLVILATRGPRTRGARLPRRPWRPRRPARRGRS